MSNTLYKKFDFLKWLKDININVQHSGSNIGKEWVGINCVFCQDTGYHLGIHKKSKTISCWKCQTKGNIITLIQKFHPEISVQTILKRYQGIALTDNNKPARNFNKKCTLPKNATSTIYKPHKKYLLSRNFNPKQLYKKYQLKSIGIDAYWGYRIIVPIYQNKQLITFIGRDITNEQEIRYKACPIEQSVLNPKNIIYNMQNIAQQLILVEGVTDVWRIGNGCGATMGASLSTQQLSQILNQNIKKVYILFDNDETGKRESIKIGATLSQYIETEILTLPKDVQDPGNLCFEDVKELRKLIFQKIY